MGRWATTLKEAKKLFFITACRVCCYVTHMLVKKLRVYRRYIINVRKKGKNRKGVQPETRGKCQQGKADPRTEKRFREWWPETKFWISKKQRRSLCRQQRDSSRKRGGEGNADLGKGQRHLPTPSDCHPNSHCSLIKLKD